MLSLRPTRRLCNFSPAAVATAAAAASESNAKTSPSKPLLAPALDRLKSERNPDKLFHLFNANATNPILVENRFAFDDTVSRLAGARRFDYIERLLDHQLHLPQGRREGFVVRIIKLYGKAGMTQHAVDTFYRMHLFGCCRTVKNKRWEIGTGLWNRMLLKGLMPSLATFNVRIQFLVCMRRAWDANATMGLMRRVGIAPDEATYNLVIKGFCRAGFIDMAKKVFDALLGEGHKPNSKIYQTMIHYLCKSGDFNLAYTMCRDSMQKNWFPNVDTICMLLKSLKGIGQINRARTILMLVKRRKPPFSSDHLTAMWSILNS
ncbi:hypothetical protein Ahy_A07g037380 isoform B [Arachis hypogaea]|uniref:Pentatricopeptide repeat-containing protein n=1 Tax=Arachis hypogaea TaxID=3818 RepID=A0A445CIL5_ARAHY|nr:hypothetical protein Ahy_A07g037380 isoform B [Arachis hypogaea]